jgi:hypothetical protein
MGSSQGGAPQQARVLIAIQQAVEMRPRLRTGRDWLAIAAMAFLAANLIHVADHLRQHLAGFNAVIFVGGSMLTMGAVTVGIVALRHHRHAPLVATVFGFQAAVLVALAHIAPHWSVLSDSYIDDVHPDALSWGVMLLEVAAGFVLGVVGAHTLRAQSRAANEGGALTHGLERAVLMKVHE